jgi:hypothetical protein
MSHDDIKTKSHKANEIVRACKTKLGSIRKKQNSTIGNYYKAVDSKKIEKIKKEIEVL